MSELDPATLAKIHTVRIHPSIGIARVGNSTAEDGWFYGPEIPGRMDTPEGGFKDAKGAVKRQAARFRLYGFAEDGEVVCELNKTNGFDLNWKMEVGNQKAAWYDLTDKYDELAWQPGSATLRNPKIQANLPPEKRDRLYILSGEKTLSGPNHERVYLDGLFKGSPCNPGNDPPGVPLNVRLGEARTDEEGHLVVLPGYGDSQSVRDEHEKHPLIMDDFNSPDWVDDTCDGWITVSATHGLSNQLFTPKHKARVIGSTPKYTTEVYCPTSLHDVMEDIFEAKARKDNPNYLKDLEVEWYRHIWPLLQIPPRISWVNGQANRGHGFKSPGNFYNEKWQEKLKRNDKETEDIRKGVFMRMRLPYDQDDSPARNGQAYQYFMPPLSGDGGRVTETNPSTFASVTRLQYDRLTKWANGDFTVGNPLPTYKNFEDIPLTEQPAALTKASLEPTIGAGIYPGIEMGWNAELPENYESDEPYTALDSLLPGDLSKSLSLPWQSDFYMCRSYWWPSTRPDAIVTKLEYEGWVKTYKEQLDAGLLPLEPLKRVPWERGLRVNYTDVYRSQPLFANTDMVKFWHKLGFIVKAEYQPKAMNELPVFVETDRDPDFEPKEGGPKEESTKAAELDAYADCPSPVAEHLPTPKRPAEGEAIETIESMKVHLQSAIAVELSTIPLYLFGMYSVKIPDEYLRDPRYVHPVISAVRNVVAEEMLHLSLAGNILRAIGGKPKLYHPDIIPKYPGNMLHRIPDLPLLLRPMTKENLETFIELEKPKLPGSDPQPDKYNTLGQFYKAIKIGLDNLNKKHPDLFHPDTAPFQFAPGLGYQAKNMAAGGSVVVTDLESAFSAIDTIVEQGEGYVPDKLAGVIPEENHYNTFVHIRDDDDVKWDTHPLIDDPMTEDYKSLDKRIHQVSRTFDAAYCFLLITIESLWDISDGDERKKLVLGNMFTVMMGILPPLAKFLISQKFPEPYDKVVAAPCFNYFDFKGGDPLGGLIKEMQTTLDAYLDVKDQTPNQVTIHDYGPQLQALLPIYNSITGLVSLNTFTTMASPLVKTARATAQNWGNKGFGRLVL